MPKVTKNQRGVALMLVLSSIMLLTTMLVEFAYNTNVNYNLALNERDRLKAYYLAKSAMSFMMLELKFDQMFRKVVEQQNLAQYLGNNAQLPLCQQFPLSTGLIRTVFTGGGIEGALGAMGGEDADKEQVEDKVEDMRRDVSVSDEKSAEEFLSFEGDFDGECVDESVKIDLNGFAGLPKTSDQEGGVSSFDQYKRYLYRFLARPEYELLFEESDVKPQDAIDNIGDWVDPDTDVNTFEGRTSGAERSIYDRAKAEYKVRNGKLLTLIEAYLIDGVVDDWFGALEDNFTVYGGGKVNICQASRELIESLIRRYVDSTPNLPPVNLDDKDEMERLVKAITDACAEGKTGKGQQEQAVASALDAAITAKGEEKPAEETAEKTPPTGTDAAGEKGFASYITSERRFYTLKLAGQAFDTTVRIKAVIDVKEQDPKKWKFLYWHVY